MSMPGSTIGSSSAEWPEAQCRLGYVNIVVLTAMSLVISTLVVVHAVPKACFSQRPKCSSYPSKKENKCAQRKNVLPSLVFPFSNIQILLNKVWFSLRALRIYTKSRHFSWFLCRFGRELRVDKIALLLWSLQGSANYLLAGKTGNRPNTAPTRASGIHLYSHDLLSLRSIHTLPCPS